MAKVPLTPYANGLPIRWTEAKTASYTCTKYDSGTIFHTTGATAAVVFTLPAISDGPFYFLFISGADVDMTVTAQTADTIVTYNDLNADSIAFSTSSEKIGGAVEIICDGTTLIALIRASDGRYQTATIATS
jgi:hypothetical protein